MKRYLKSILSVFKEKYECSKCHNMFSSDGIKYFLWTRYTGNPLICNECYVPIQKRDDEISRARCLCVLGLKYHWNIGKINNKYYDYIVLKNNKQRVIAYSANYIEKAKDPAITRLDYLETFIAMSK